jgi:hypothetical protein
MLPADSAPRIQDFLGGTLTTLFANVGHRRSLAERLFHQRQLHIAKQFIQLRDIGKAAASGQPTDESDAQQVRWLIYGQTPARAC